VAAGGADGAAARRKQAQASASKRKQAQAGARRAPCAYICWRRGAPLRAGRRDAEWSLLLVM